MSVDKRDLPNRIAHHIHWRAKNVVKGIGNALGLAVFDYMPDYHYCPNTYGVNFWRKIEARGLLEFGEMASQVLPQDDFEKSKQWIGKLDYPKGEIWMDIGTSFQARRLFACEKEPETVEWIETHVKPGQVLYDIGANVGAYSFVTFVATKGDCTVYAIEPSFSTFAALSNNVMLNNCQGKIIPLHVALSHETKLLNFNYSSTIPGAAMHGLRDARIEDGKPVQVKFTQPILAYSLDDLVKRFTLLPPNHIKLDVDGAQFDVLCGAGDILAHPELSSILVEVDTARDPSGNLVHLIENKGFHVASRHPRHNVAGQPITEFNYIFER